MNNTTHFHKSGLKIVWEKKPRPRTWGLALGGGAARGIAHIGVLQVLEENGLRPDCIAGTSVGSLVGGLYAAGVSTDKMVDVVRKLRWSDVTGITMPKLGLLDVDRMIGLIDQITGGPVDFADLKMPFAAVAADIVNGDMVVLNTGKIAPAIRASCSIPSVFTPARRNDRLLVDGGILNNLPVSVAEALGAGYVVAVDLLPLGSMLGKEPNNLLEITVTAIYTLMRSTHNEGPQADRVIAPNVGHLSLASLSAVDELLAAGRSAAEATMPDILRDLGMTE